jgi:hypothetical protein
MTFDMNLGFHITRLCNEYNYLDYKFYRALSNNDLFLSPWTFLAHSTIEQEAEAIVAVREHFNWDVYSLVSGVDIVS